MKKPITNNTGVGISVAAWLAHDSYAYNPNTKAISATSLLKPIRELVLSFRLEPKHIMVGDVIGNVASNIGTAIHNGIEDVWVSGAYKQSLLDLGYPKPVIEMIRVNPTAPELAIYAAKGEEILPVYTEKRTNKTFAGWEISGEFDFCAEGDLEDFKSTKVYTYVHETNNDAYAWQGSIYRWLNPDIITGGSIKIQYIFTDWKAFELLKDPRNYPPEPVLEKSFPLKSIMETERFIKNKLILITKLEDAPQSEIPECTPDELWQKETVWKYYKVAANAGVAGKRSTKNFDNHMDAIARKSEDGNVGKILEVKGEVTKCKYCSVVLLCEQKDKYIADGSLKLK